MENREAELEKQPEKIVLPEALQRAMMNFFREAAALKQAQEGNRQITPD